MSYAHDSSQHKEDVLRLAAVLRACGVAVLLDEWVGDDRVDWAVWAIKGIEQSDFVVVVGSRRYREVSDERLPADVHRGVRFEAPLLREHLWRDRATWFGKILPVVLPGHGVDEIPTFLQPHSGTHYVLTEITEEGVSSLVRAMRGASRGRPGPAGAVARTLPPRGRPPVNGIEVPRPELLEPLVRDLLANENRVVLTGPGGFGKTTLAALAAADPRVRRRFGQRQYWVTLGERTRDGELHAQVRDLVVEISGKPSPYSTPNSTRTHLAKLLSARPTLLVADDVWDPGQLEPFSLGKCVLLVTSRLAAFPGAAVHAVDRMGGQQAHALLTGGLPGAGEADWSRLLHLCAGWPILLTLVHDMVWYRVGTEGESVVSAVRHVADRLEAAGPTAFDPEPEHRSYRHQAVAAVVEASVHMLATTRRPNWPDRFAELAVAPRGSAIPLSTLAKFWRGLLPEDEVEDLCRGLVRVSLAQKVELGGSPALRVHDVIHEYLEHAGGDSLPVLHDRLLRAHAPGEWWYLPQDEPYLWDHLAYHLSQAEPGGADELVCDLRWLEARLRHDGPSAIDADFAHATSDLAARMYEALARSAHLLGPLEPPPSLAATIVSRLRGTEALGEVVESHVRTLRGSWLEPVWPLPDQPAPAYRGALATGTSEVRSFAVAPDGSWLATGHQDGAVRTWDVVTGRLRAQAQPHDNAVNVVRISSTGTVVSAEINGRVAVWDPAKDEVRWCRNYRTFIGDVAIDPVRGRLAVCGGDLGVRFFDQTGTPVLVRPWWRWLVNLFLGNEELASRVRTMLLMLLVVIIGAGGGSFWVMLGLVLGLMAVDFLLMWRGPELDKCRDLVHSVCYSADGRFLVTGLRGGATKVWHARGGRRRKTFTGMSSSTGSVALDHHGEWLATATFEDGFRLRHVRTRQERVVEPLAAAGTYTVCFSSDGTMVACGTNSQVSVWAVSDGRRLAVLAGLPHAVSDASFTPDNTSLLTAGCDSSVRRWELADLPATAGPQEDPIVRGVAFCADEEHVVIGGPENAVSIRSVRGTAHRTLTGHDQSVSAVATAFDGSYFASSDFAGTVRRWHLDGTPAATPIEHPSDVTSLALTSDGRLAAGCRDYTVHVHDGAGDTTVLTGHTAGDDDIGYGITDLAVTTDSTRLVSVDYLGALWVWDTATWRADIIRRSAGKGNKGLHCIAVSPDGDWLVASGAESTVEVRRMTGEVVRHLHDHTTWVAGLAFSPDGTQLASVDLDGVVRIWQVPAYTCVAALRMDGALNSCAWSPSGRLLAASGSGGAYLFTQRTG